MIDFLIVGAPKAGTTSTFEYLKLHDNVFIPKIKEPHYFASEKVENRIEGVVQTKDEYKNLFKDKKGNQITGESSVFYLYYHQHVIEKLQRETTSPEKIKIIICVRDPVDRAYSAYLQARRYNPDENLSFEDALDQENSRKISPRISPMLFYKGCSAYHEAIQNYKNNFENVFILDSNELKSRPKLTVNKLFAFLNLPPLEEVPLIKKNLGGNDWTNEKTAYLIKNIIAPEKLRRFLKKNLRPIHNLSKNIVMSQMMKKSPPINEDTRKKLEIYFKEEILYLDEILKKTPND